MDLGWEVSFYLHAKSFQRNAVADKPICICWSSEQDYARIWKRRFCSFRGKLWETQSLDSATPLAMNPKAFRTPVAAHATFP